MPELISAVVLAAEISRITSAAGGWSHELTGLWGPLREILPFSAAWLGVLDTRDRRFVTAAATGHDPPARGYNESRAYYAEVESSGILRHRKPICLRRGGPSAGPSGDGLWGPPGQHDGLGVPLIAADGRPVGLLVLLTDATGHSKDTGCQVIETVAPMIAAAIDPMTTIIGLTGLVVDARASAVVGPGGAVQPLPGSPPHPLLTSGSQVVAIASDRLRTHQKSPIAFLCPYPGDNDDDYLRVTVISCPRVRLSPFAELVIVSSPGDLHGLTRRELEVLGLVIEGSTNRQIASTLFIAQRTVAAHLEHIRSKLDVPTRTAAAIRSLNQALYVPPQLIGTDD
jgi:DNA-binding CsgD family transcriptional regulator